MIVQTHQELPRKCSKTSGKRWSRNATQTIRQTVLDKKTRKHKVDAVLRKWYLHHPSERLRVEELEVGTILVLYGCVTVWGPRKLMVFFWLACKMAKKDGGSSNEKHARKSTTRPRQGIHSPRRSGKPRVQPHARPVNRFEAQPGRPLMKKRR